MIFALIFFFYSDVKEMVQECVGGAALQQCKSKIQSYGEQTSSALKKHVYANYMQFIETAKEISRMTHFLSMIFILNFNVKIHSFIHSFRLGIGDVSIVTLVDRTAKYFVNTTRAEFN